MRLALIAALFLAAPAHAFEPITDQDAFVRTVDGRALSRLGIRLNVDARGQITGRAFGQPVSGEWRWQDGFFCRTLGWGERDLGFNCQRVLQDGETLRFVADRGQGDMADFSLR